MMTFEQAKACVLYEDNHLLVVCKPVNMPVQADASGDEDLLTAMKAYVKQAYNKPGEVYLGLVHRLDRPVGNGLCPHLQGSAAADRASKIPQNGENLLGGCARQSAEKRKTFAFSSQRRAHQHHPRRSGGHCGRKTGTVGIPCTGSKEWAFALSNQTANRAVAPDPGAVFDGRLAALGRCALWRR